MPIPALAPVLSAELAGGVFEDEELEVAVSPAVAVGAKSMSSLRASRDA
jgi:hypothetical protein